MPTVTELQLFAVELPFKAPFRHAAAERRTSESLFLRARLDDGSEGWGESLPRPYVSGESRADAFRLLRDEILPSLLGREFESLTDVSSFLQKCNGKAPPEWIDPDVPQSSAWCSVDLALIDAFARARGEPLALGPRENGLSRADAVAQTRYSGVVSADKGWRFVRSLLKMRAFRFPHIKVKLGPGDTTRAATTARKVLGRGVDLRVDANMAWDVDQALSIMEELSPLGIQSYEQPIAATDLAGLAQLVRESSSVVMVDEGLTDRDSLQTLISRRACTGVNIRISKCGGLFGAYARCREALDAGLVLQIGCQVGESSLLSSAHVTLLSALSSLTPGVRYAEGCFGRHLLREDPALPLVQFGYGGRPPPRPAGPGLGVEVDKVRLRHWTVDEARIL
jgi:L-alanine-DL-glutamate epimerase-like enolase superfamily enzyme